MSHSPITGSMSNFGSAHLLRRTALLAATCACLWLLVGCGKSPSPPADNKQATGEPGASATGDKKTPVADAPGSPAKTITNSFGMKLVLIPAGKFMMGSPETEEGRKVDEGPQHEVEITKSFYMGVYEVTQEEYEKVMGKNPSWFSVNGEGKDKVKGLETRRFPVEYVSWEDAIKFCDKLSKLPEEQKAGRTYRLPTEAEWEYACRAGTNTVFHYGDSLSSDQDNFNGNNPYGGAAKGKYLERPTEVGSYKPNAFGLHDMHGNVLEWCSDGYDKNYYGISDKKDPQGSLNGNHRVLRGGSWSLNGQRCRAANRDGAWPNVPNGSYGFRVVCVPAIKTP